MPAEFVIRAELVGHSRENISPEGKRAVDKIIEAVNHTISNILSIDIRNIYADSYIAESMVDDNNLGADIFKLAEIYMALENEFGVVILSQEEQHLRTVWDLVDFIAKRIPSE
jgi:acyl carrier protein